MKFGDYTVCGHSGPSINACPKVNKQISNLNRGEALMLDKNGMIAEVFETFFERCEI